MPKNLSAAAALTMLVIGLPSYYFGRGVPRALATRLWPATAGTVTRSMVTGSSRPCGRDDRSYLILYYTYKVNDVSHLGTQAFVWPACPTKSVAKKVVDRYPEGKTVEVHYDPVFPSDAVLETGIIWYAFDWFYVLLGVLAWLVVLWRWLKGSPSQTPQPSWQRR